MGWSYQELKATPINVIAKFIQIGNIVADNRK